MRQHIKRWLSGHSTAAAASGHTCNASQQHVLRTQQASKDMDARAAPVRMPARMPQRLAQHARCTARADAHSSARLRMRAPHPNLPEPRHARAFRARMRWVIQGLRRHLRIK